MKPRIVAALFVVVTVAAVPLLAHHTAAYLYNVDKPITLSGTVTSVEWKNPHVIVHVDVKGQDGAVANWTLEARAVYIMRRNGFAEDFLKAGDSATLTVCTAKDGSHTGGLEAIASPDGSLPKSVGECVIPR